MLTILKTEEGREVYVHHIKELRMFPEELTGDGEYGHWGLDALKLKADAAGADAYPNGCIIRVCPLLK